MNSRKIYSFEKLSKHDLVKFSHNNKTYYGKVFEVVNEWELQVIISDQAAEDFPKGLPITIDRRSILQSYPSTLVKTLTPRLSLKQIWKNLVFREVKTVIPGDVLYAEYRYISPTGFEQIQRFPTLAEAQKNISPRHYDNIVVHYKEYYGFTTDQSLVKQDLHYDKEIFFSKKCYCKLDWTENPTGDFVFGDKEDHTLPPLPDSLICGIVETGEKGLFFRKWFVCSRQFWILWAMVCDSRNDSLFESNKYNMSQPKSFDKLMSELDTSSYNVGYNIKLSLEEKRHKHYIWNLEKAALFFPDRYQKVARVLFHRAHLEDRSGNSYSEDCELVYDKFQKRLRRQLMWPKRVKF